jgi:hypothetical protein
MHRAIAEWRQTRKRAAIWENQGQRLQRRGILSSLYCWPASFQNSEDDLCCWKLLVYGTLWWQPYSTMSINFKLLLSLFSFSGLSNFHIDSGKIRIILTEIGSLACLLCIFIKKDAFLLANMSLSHKA